MAICMGISHTVSNLCEVMSLLSLFVRGGKTHKDKMTSNHTAFHLTIIPFIIKRNQSVSCRLDTTFTEARIIILSPFTILHTVIIETKFKQ